MSNPCHGCVERVFGCHGGCKRYIQWKSEQTGIKEAEQSNREVDYQHRGYMMVRTNRARKRTGGK